MQYIIGFVSTLIILTLILQNQIYEQRDDRKKHQNYYSIQKKKEKKC